MYEPSRRNTGDEGEREERKERKESKKKKKWRCFAGVGPFSGCRAPLSVGQIRDQDDFDQDGQEIKDRVQRAAIFFQKKSGPNN
jgi:hypothetical protein